MFYGTYTTYMTDTPELLAPAGDWDCARAAVANGADAIYFGLEHFNARMRARNFTRADLPELMAFLHRRGVRGYVTFNTLIFADEIEAAEDTLRTLITAGVDAVIVQDIGLCRLIRRLSPDMPIHASTQMTITSAAGVAFARELGCELVVLARECSIREIAAIRDSLGASGKQLPLEVFVHGALCVAYSGQCLTSESLGGRSANRGECAQACRMTYDLISDGQPVPLGDRRYLLSPQDLAGLDLLPQLAEAGVASLKIEGRLKTPEYVASITRLYREALDRLHTSETAATLKEDRYAMEMAFSRGLHTGWLEGIDNQRLVHARFGKKRGVLLGRVTGRQGDRIRMQLVAPLKPGDGVVFDAGHPDQPEEGGFIHAIDPIPSTPGDVLLRFGRGDIDPAHVQAGDRVWKTSDPELDRQLRKTFASDAAGYRRPIHLRVVGRLGEPLQVTAGDSEGHKTSVTSAMPLAPAVEHPLDRELLNRQLGRLGGTPFTLGTLDADLDDGLILPVSELNRMRRELVAALDALRAGPRSWTLNDVPPGQAGRIDRAQECVAPASPQLIPLVRSLDQLEAVLDLQLPDIYCEFENPKSYRFAVERVRSGSPSSRVFVAPPRIFKSGEEWILNQVRSSEPDGYLIRNYDHLACFGDTPGIGDFSLNIANPLTAEYFIRHHGLERLTASYDLNVQQLESLLQGCPAEWFEVTLHQHMPMFHMEHCVFCAFLSKGTDYSNCGRPCDRHDVRLRDRVGAEHVLKADVGCRNTLFNAKAQTGAEHARHLMDLGVRRFRVEFLVESAVELRQTLDAYRQLLEGRMSGRELWQDLKLHHRLGVTRGPLDR